MKFDEAFKQLEEITSVLERGDLGLEESVKMYEKGMELALSCKKILAETESKISQLEETINGDLVLQTIQLENQNNVTE